MLASLIGVAAGAESLRLKSTVPLPGVKGRFDHFATDTNRHRIFVAALGNNTVEVIDAAAVRRLHTITGLHKPTGVVFLPEANRLFVANGDDGTLKVFDGTSYELIKSIGGVDDADNVRYDGKTRLLYVGYGEGALGIIDAQKIEQAGSIKLKAHPESVQLEQTGPRIFVNVPDAKQIAVVDREQRAVIATWPMEKFQANFPMALDEANHRLFIGCRKPARLVVLDTATGQAIADLPMSGDTDDLFWDGARRRIIASCGEGFIDVWSELEGKFQLSQRIATRSGARTSWYSAVAGELFLTMPERSGAAAELRMYSVSR